jgi:ABC-type branched-subunit amino acid transport system ATPase component
MLKRVEIKYFRSCQNVVLDNLGRVIVLAGRNAAGKTNILRAIEWLASVATSAALPKGGVESGNVLLDVLIGDSIYHYSLKVELRQSPSREGPLAALTEELSVEGVDGALTAIFGRKNEEVNLSQTESKIGIGMAAPCMPALLSLLPADVPILASIRPFISFLARIRYYPLLDSPNLDKYPISKAEYDEWLARYNSTGDPGEEVSPRLVHAFLTNTAQLDELRSLLGPNGLGLLDEILIHEAAVPTKSEDHKEQTEKWYWFYFQPSLQAVRGRRFLIPFENLSAGTRRVFRILVSLIFDQATVMLLEHPEDGIHRGLLGKLIDVLQTYSIQSQLIISSHSSVVFNMLHPGSVRLVTSWEGNTRVRPLTPDELTLAGRFLEEDGAFSDFLESVSED